MNDWHILPPWQRDNAWKALQAATKQDNHTILTHWKQYLSCIFDQTTLSALRNHYQKASTNQHQPSLYHFQTLPSHLQETVHILHVLHANTRQEAVLSPRFDYLTKQYLEAYA